MKYIPLIALCVLSTSAVACDEDPPMENPPICDAVALQDALDDLLPGQMVQMGDCTIEGQFRVPAGATLTGMESSVIRSAMGRTIELGDNAAISRVRIESGGEYGIVGTGSAEVSDLVVHADRGVAIAFRGGGDSRVVLRELQLTGPVTDPSDSRWLRAAGFAIEGTCSGAECECTPGEFDEERVCDGDGRWATWAAVYGLYGVDANLTLENVSIEGFAEFGAVLSGCTTMWNGGAVRNTLGVGVMVREGMATIADVDIAAVAEGVRGLAAYGILAVEGAVLNTTDLSLMDNDRYGLVLLNASGLQEDLLAMGNGDVAVWVGMSAGVRLDRPTLMDNGFAGVVMSASDDVTVDGGMIGATRTVTRTLGSIFGVQEIGDGVHISASTNVAVSNLTLRDNERGGILVDTSAGVPVFSAVDVEASAMGFGAEGGPRTDGDLSVGAPMGWDDGIMRGPIAAGRDGVAGAVLDIVGIPVPVTAMDQVGIVFPMF